MAETLKFGPQWLHNLIDGPTTPTSPPSATPSTAGFPSAGQAGPAPGRYKLADHRYGREEMLALYMPALKIPDNLRQFQSILKEQTLQPMAFIAPSEDEQRLMSQSVNSTAVLRMMGRGAGPSQRGGRGGGDRGRGRGRGRGEGGFSGFHRQTSLEDEGYSRTRHGRGEGWEEGEKQPRAFERGAIGFGGPRSVTFEEGPTSPRRDFSRSMSSENWRDARMKNSEEDDEGGDWRRAGPRDKWGSRGSWRDHRERDRDREYGRGYDDYETGRYERPYRTKSGSWGDGPESDLPEWSTTEADDIDNIGTFDSSGAFMFIKDREIDEKERRRFEAGRQRALAQGREDAGLNHRNTQNGADTDKDGDHGGPDRDRSRTADTADTQDPVESPAESQRSGVRGKESRSASPPSSQGPGQDSPKEGTPPARHVRGPDPQHADHLSQTQHQHQHQHQQAARQEQQEQDQEQKQQQQQQHNLREPSPQQQPLPQASQKEEVMFSRKAGGVKDRSAVSKTPHPVPSGSPHQAAPGRGVVDDDFGHLEKAAEDLVATWTAEEDAKSDCKAKVESGGVPLDHEDAKKWFYRDPQGDLQGPFKAAEMAEWFSAGYFTMNLLVKRGCDTTFQALGELIKRWGRVPFLPGPSPPPFKEAAAAAMPMPTPPQIDPQQEQLTMMQQQMILQQQLYLQQMQMSQMMATLQQQESFAKLTPQQQQQLALQFMLKHQQQILQQAPQQAPSAAGQHSPPQPPPQPQQQPPPSLSPRSEQQAAFQRQLSHQQAQQQVAQQQAAQQQAAQQQAAQQQAAQQQAAQQAAQQQAQQAAQQQAAQQQAAQQQAAQQQAQQQAAAAAAAQAVAAAQQAQAPGGTSQPGDAGVAGFHRSVSQSHSDENTIWGGANPTVSSAGWTAPTSVWDIEPPKPPQSLEEIQRLERMKMDQQQREEVERREAERRRQEEELRKRQEEEERRRHEDELRRRQEEERRKQVEMELERQRMEQLERIRLQRESEENARREEERRRREEEERRRREEEERRLREAEERRRQLEEQRRKEQEELERKRQEEIRRRQEKAEEMRRQQQEALRRLQQEQMANIQLPSTAQWANSSGSAPGNGTPSLTEIQEMEAQRAVKEAEEKKRRLDQQRQQLAAIQQQQQQQSKTWAQQTQRMPSGSGATTPTSNSGAPSLLEIQQEQAMQLERDKQRQQQQQKASPTAALPLRTAAVWSGASQATHWAAEGAWGNQQNRVSSAGFWDDAIGGASTKKAAPSSSSSNSNANSNFPSLSSTVNTQQAVVSNKSKSSKAKREEETVQRLFQQAMKPKDEFTQWCENALRGIQSSVDVPTFIVFLQDVESPYEVHDYVRSYLGEGKEANEFATQFLERRSKFKNHLKQEQPEEMWGPAPAVNPNLKNDDHRSSNNNAPSSASSATSGSSKNSSKKKKRMQKVDSSILGFTVHADPERVNMGDIEPIA